MNRASTADAHRSRSARRARVQENASSNPSAARLAGWIWEDTLTPSARGLAHPDGTTELVLGDLLSYEEVCTRESLSRSPACTTSPTACRSRAA
jgi:hypothetical protein